MSNKTLIIVLSFFVVTLILVGIVFNNNFSGITEERETEEVVKKPKKHEEVKQPEGEATIGDYTTLEASLRSAASKYIKEKEIDEDYKIVISYDKLKKTEYIDNLIDPANETECSGYVIYEGNNIDPYIKCGDNYMTTNYNETLE